MVELHFAKPADRKNRVLSEVSMATDSITESVLKQITSGEGKHDGLQKSEMREGDTGKEFQEATFATQSGNQVVWISFGCLN